MRTRTLLAAGGAVAVLLLGAPASAHEGTHATAVGWWTSSPGAQPAPDGGFEVAALGGSAVSVAALRFDAGGGGTSATLTLFESGGTVTAATALQVCTTKDAWKPANPGALSDAPNADCTGAVDLTRDETAKTWKGDVGALLSAGSLMVVPGDAPGGGAPVDPGFRVTFSEAALAVTAAPDVSSSPAFATPEGGSGSGDSFSFPSTSSPSFATPSAPVGSVEAAPPPAPAEASTPTTEAATEQTFRVAGGAEGGGGGASKPWARLLLLVPLSAAGGLGSVRAKKLLAQRGVVDA